MDERNEEMERTEVLGQRALDEIKARSLSLTPRNFEFWYIYVSGERSDLAEAVERLIAAGIDVNQGHIDSLFSSYVLRIDLSSEISAAGDRLGKEIDVVIAEIDLATRDAAVYGDALHIGSNRFTAGISLPETQDVIHTLLRSTVEMQARNKVLEQRLNASRSEIQQLNETLEAVRSDSLRDPLTGLGNRKQFDLAIGDAVASATRTGMPLCVLVCDVDHFKKINDKYGHLVGDEALRHVAHSLRDSVRTEDITCRIGGEEFAVVLPNAALETAAAVGERIRQKIANRRLVRRATGERFDKLTISVGVAMLRSADTAVSLHERADRCLYAAKRWGRDRVFGENDELPT